MNIRPTLVVLAAVVAASFGSPVAGQRAGQPMIVVFHDDAPFTAFRPGQADERSRAKLETLHRSHAG